MFMNHNTKYKTIKPRTASEKEYLQKRLNIVEGQVRGVSQMIADNRYCSDILIQLSAINKSLKSIGEEILRNHLTSCFINNIKDNQDEAIAEIMDLFKKLN